MKSLSAMVVGFALVLTFLPQARAVEWMTGSELIGHCREYVEHPTSLDGIACASYVQGFLGGAEATDAVVAETVRQQYRERSRFASRAAETRVKQRLERFGPTAYAGYCLPREVSNTGVVATVIAFIAAHPESAELTAQDVVYGALKEFYPCG